MVKYVYQERLCVIESLNTKVGVNQAYYLKAGDGLPVLLLHGGASDSRDWIRTITALSDSYSCYAPDLLGYGLSDRANNGYYISDFVEFVTGFIEALGSGPQFLVGHSLGGRVCLEISLKYPEMVRKLVLINTMGFGKISRLGGFLSTSAWAMRKVAGRSQPYPELLTKDGEEPGWICHEELPRLNVPTLIVWRRYDPYFPVALAHNALELIPGARLVVLPGYGHAPHIQKRSSFNRVLRDFLDDKEEAD